MAEPVVGSTVEAAPTRGRPAFKFVVPKVSLSIALDKRSLGANKSTVRNVDDSETVATSETSVFRHLSYDDKVEYCIVSS